MTHSHSLPPPVEDFVGRAPALVAIAQAFRSGRRVVWLHGRSGIGKSALAAEFCRFYALPGDRLFSPARRLASPMACGSGVSSGSGDCKEVQPETRLVRLAGLAPAAAWRRLEEAFGGGGVPVGGG